MASIHSEIGAFPCNKCIAFMLRLQSGRSDGPHVCMQSPELCPWPFAFNTYGVCLGHCHHKTSRQLATQLRRFSNVWDLLTPKVLFGSSYDISKPRTTSSPAASFFWLLCCIPAPGVCFTSSSKIRSRKLCSPTASVRGVHTR